MANHLKGVLLDIDGTLVDSNNAHALAWEETLKEFGYRVQFGNVRRLIGMGGDKLLPELTGLQEDSPKGQRISTRRRELFKSRYLPAVRAFPGVRELLSRIRRDGLTIAIATSATKDEMSELLNVTGAEDIIQHETSSADAEDSKPDPDIIRAALRKSGLAPAEVVMVGDTPYDVDAATRAGVKTIALRCGGWGDTELAGAEAIYDSPADLLAHYDVSPLGRDGD
jgi:HAD superfamily hydrolase (TIGR01509 family)